MTSTITTSYSGMTAAESYRLHKGPMSLNGTKHYSDAEMDAKAQEFETMFIGQMLKPMFEGIETDGMFGGGEGEETYRSFMIDEYAKMITKAGGIGIADHVKAEMIRMQEMQ